jgi:hypothetical protein
MSRFFNQTMMALYGDLELAHQIEQRQHEEALNAAWEMHEAEEDLYNGIIENRPYEFYWMESPRKTTSQWY